MSVMNDTDLADDFDLACDAYGRLVFTERRSGRSHAGVIAVRAWPIAAPGQGIALMSAEGRELAWIPDLNLLDGERRALVEQALNQREFLPEIQRIKQATRASGQSLWQVQTDRGDTELALKGEESIRRIGQGALLVSDVHGVQFLIRDFRKMDAATRKLLDGFM